MVQRVQMKTVNYDGGNIYYPDSVVDMEDNKANYLKNFNQAVIASAAGLSTAPTPPTKIDTLVKPNLIVFPNDFDNAAWVKTPTGTGVAPIVTPNAVLAPDGTMTADKIDCNMGGGSSSADQSNVAQTVLNINGAYCKHLVWLRADAPITIGLRNPTNGGQFIPVSLTTGWQQFEAVGIATTSTVLAVGLRGTYTAVNLASFYAWGAKVLK